MHGSHRRSALAVALTILLVVAGAAAAADRPRIRPTPGVGGPAASADPSVPAASAAASPAPGASGLSTPAVSVPPAAGCLGTTRPGASPEPAPTLSPAPVTRTAAPDGTERVVIAALDLRLDLPADWVAVQGEDLATLEEIPELTATIAAIEAGSLVLLAADVLPGDTCDLGGTLNLFDLGAALDPRLLALTVDAIALGLEELDEVQGDVTVTEVDLPVGPAQRLTFRFDATEDGAVTAWWVRADAFVASGRTVLAAYAAPQDIADDAKTAFNAIAKSIRER